MSSIARNFSLLNTNLAIVVKVLSTLTRQQTSSNITAILIFTSVKLMLLLQWPNDKHIICNINNDILIKIPSHPYVLVNRSVLCNCGIEADNHHLLESIAACDSKIIKLIMYFTIILGFANYLDMLPNLTDSLPINKDRTRHEEPLPLNLSIPNFDNSQRHRPTTLKDFMNDYINNKEFLICNKGMQ